MSTPNHIAESINMIWLIGGGLAALACVLAYAANMTRRIMPRGVGALFPCIGMLLWLASFGEATNTPLRQNAFILVFFTVLLIPFYFGFIGIDKRIAKMQTDRRSRMRDDR